MLGFSASDLWAMRQAYVEYGCDPILQQLAEELPSDGAAILAPDKPKMTMSRAPKRTAGAGSAFQQLKLTMATRVPIAGPRNVEALVHEGRMRK